MELNNQGILSSLKLSEVGITDGLIQWYPLNGDQEDYTPNRNNGTVYGATIATGIDGKLQYDFDGTDDYIKIIDDIVENPTQLTISQWFMKQTGGADYECVIHKGSDTTIGQSEYWLGVQNADYLTATIGQRTGVGWQQGQTNVLCQYDNWYHLCATWDGSVVKVYVNGEYNMEYELSTYSYISYPTRFGASGDAQGYLFRGKIQDVRIYDRQLTQQEVGIIYDLTKESQVAMKVTNTTTYVKSQFKEI